VVMSNTRRFINCASYTRVLYQLVVKELVCVETDYGCSKIRIFDVKCLLAVTRKLKLHVTSVCQRCLRLDNSLPDVRYPRTWPFLYVKYV
jgi:hypothetical protein